MSRIVTNTKNFEKIDVASLQPSRNHSCTRFPGRSDACDWECGADEC